ncbi:MAG TPA: cytochrome c [Candidatus Acidoferrales bacterium]|jgi:mono/diheme cytochrome c family protein|nr:cytochrome c [Candidatus Acidoferrales bacterium]
MNSRFVAKAVAWCLLLGFMPGVRAAQEKPAKQVKPDPSLATGAKLYKENCAVCHGDDGKGNGPPPKSSPFTEPPPDLTTLTKRHNGEFPTGYVKSVLRTGVRLPDHGPAEMPVWGVVFRAMMKSDEAKVTARIADLTNYIQSLQAK